MSCIIDKFIKKNGEYNYAYVVMIINNDIYANPGIIFAESLGKIGCKCDIVAMVDSKITSQTIFLLKNFFNKIINIDLITISHSNPIQQIILSKINIFKMTNYDKIFLIDVDTIFFTNLDNFFLDKDNKTIYLPDTNNYGFILITPSNSIYNRCIELITKYKKNPPSDFTKPFEYVLKKIYNSTNIKKIDIKISYDLYSNVDCIQYRKDKPFLMSSELTIEQRQRLDHFKIWFSYLINIINKYPEIKQYKCISESINVSKYFLASLSRFILDFIKLNKNKKKTNIKNIFCSDKITNLDYYHLDLTKEYTNKFVHWEINNYNTKSFLKYLDLEIQHGNKYFTNYYDCEGVKKLIDKLFLNNSIHLDLFLNNYLKMYSNTFVVIELNIKSSNTINTSKLTNNDVITDLKNNMVFRKEFALKKIPLKNILFNLCQSMKYNHRIELIEKNIVHQEYNVIVSIYSMVSPIIAFDSYSNFDLFIFYELNSKIRLGSIFFNSNTIKQYSQNQLLNIFENINIFNDQLSMPQLNLTQIINMVYLQTLKKYIYSVYSGNEINNLGLIVKKYNDIMLIDNNKHTSTKIKSINSNKIFFITIIFLNNFYSKNTSNIQNINVEKIYDPYYYWEFEGIKILL